MPEELLSNRQPDRLKRPKRAGSIGLFALAALLLVVGLSSYAWANHRYSTLLSQFKFYQAEVQFSERRMEQQRASYPRGTLFMMSDSVGEWKLREQANKTKLDWETNGPIFLHLRRLGLGIACFLAACCWPLVLSVRDLSPNRNSAAVARGGSQVEAHV